MLNERRAEHKFSEHLKSWPSTLLQTIQIWILYPLSIDKMEDYGVKKPGVANAEVADVVSKVQVHKQQRNLIVGKA